MRSKALRPLLLVALAVTALGGCAFPRAVQRVGADYNGAVAGMSNELTLLNIVRAKDGLPLHYTSVGRLSGSVVVKGSTSFGQFKDKQRTFTGKHTDQITSAGVRTTTDELTQVAVKGGNGVTPSIGGEISTGPSFDITILDGQKFYQGILAAVPFPTIENYLNQGMDNQLVLRLLVERVEFRARTEALGYKKGQLVKELVNSPSGPLAKEFADEMACYVLSGTDSEKKAKALAPLSRVTRDLDGKAGPITLEDLARFDGDKFDIARVKPPVAASSPGTVQPDLNLRGYITGNPAEDGDVVIVRPSSTKRVAELTLVTKLLKPRECYEVVATTSPGSQGPKREPEGTPESPPPEPVYLGEGKALVRNLPYIEARAAAKAAGAKPPPLQAELLPIDVDLQITFRSPERLIRYIGDYLAAMDARDDMQPTYKFGEAPVFALAKGRPEGALVSVQGLDSRWSITKTNNLRQNMQVLSLVQQLINLHKESSERPVTVPVQVVP